MKIIFLDIDGTLLDYDLKAPQSAIRAVQEARKKGNKVYLSTGRSRAEIYPSIWEIGLDGMLGGNGMYIEDNNTVIQDLVMKKEDVIQVVDWMSQNDLGFYLESKNGLFGSDNLVVKSAKHLFGNAKEENCEKVKAVFPHMIYGGELYREDVAKISFCLNPNLLEEARERFGSFLKVDSWTALGKTQDFGEFAVIGADKVHAVDKLLAYLKVGKEDTFAFGDAISDIAMVNYCQVGIAMGNAQEELKEVADYVTDSVNKDGLWNAFVKYNLV